MKNKKKKFRKTIQLVPKTIKFNPDKLAEATRRGRIRELAAMCRNQLDILISD